MWVVKLVHVLGQACSAAKQGRACCRIHAALISAVADRVEADVPESAIRQLAENEYQAHLHEIQLRVLHPARYLAYAEWCFTHKARASADLHLPEEDCEDVASCVLSMAI